MPIIAGGAVNPCPELILAMTNTMSTPISPAVRRLAISQGLSLAGRGAATTALIWVVYEATSSSWWVSAAMLAIFGVVDGGVAVDRRTWATATTAAWWS